MEITKREIIASIVIISLMLIIGFMISDKISNAQNDANAEYQKAIHIEDADLFQYGMDTSVGNAFVYGKLGTVDPVTFDEVGGQYMRIEKTEEHYNQHTRTVTKTRTNANGKTETYTETEVYYSWDYYYSWEKHSKKIKFCGVEFDYGKIPVPDLHYIDTLDESSNIRYVYYGTPIEHQGTIYTGLRDGTISKDTRLFINKNIDEAFEICTSGGGIILFWIMWIPLTVLLVCGFYYLDNRWLNN